MSAEELKKKLKRYLMVHLWNPLLFTLIILFGIYHFYFNQPDSYSSAYIRSMIGFSVVFPFVLLYELYRFHFLMKVVLDVITGLKTKILLAEVNSWVPGVGGNKTGEKRYELLFYKAGKKRGAIIRDREVCEYKFVRGNLHTVEVLNYSGFLLNAKVGKDREMLNKLP